MLNRTFAENSTFDSSEADLTSVFDSFKAALRATEYHPDRFKTPMQRAASLCRLASSSKLAQNREVEIARLTSLLPQTMQTRLTIDLFSLLSRPLSVPIPPTLIVDGAGLRLVTNKGVSRIGDADTALGELLVEAERWNQERSSRPPKFVYRTADSHPILIGHFAEAKAVWLAHTGEQRLQLYVVPATIQATLLRAHWKLSKRAAVYYIISSKSASTKSKSRLPSILKRIPEFSASQPQSPKHIAPSFVNIKSPLECWAVKRNKPIPDIDRAIQEIVRTVELGFTQGRQAVEELVADFLPDCRKRWVLLGVKGCTFTSAAKAVIENLEQKQTIDLKFILFPLFNQKQALGQRLRDIKRREEGARRMSFLGVNHITSRKSESPAQSTTGPTGQDPQPCPHSRNSLGKTQEQAFSQIINNYDEMMGNIKRYKLEMQGATNFLQRYGGLEFWELVLWRLRDRLRRDAAVGDIYQSINPEEDRTMQRGFKRILEGNYNIYYKQTLMKIHRHLGVTARQYAGFLHAFEQVVCVSPVTQEDCGIILKRFKMLESCIVVSL